MIRADTRDTTDVLYRESKAPPGQKKLQIAMPLISLITAGVVLATLLFAGISVWLAVGLAAAILTADAVVLMLWPRIVARKYAWVEVTSEDVCWNSPPDGPRRIPVSAITSAEELSDPPGVLVRYRDPNDGSEQMHAIEADSPAELLATIEWARLGDTSAPRR